MQHPVAIAITIWVVVAIISFIYLVDKDRKDDGEQMPLLFWLLLCVFWPITFLIIAVLWVVGKILALFKIIT